MVWRGRSELTFRRIGVEEGWRALFKGLGPTLVGIIPARYVHLAYSAGSTCPERPNRDMCIGTAERVLTWLSSYACERGPAKTRQGSC